MIEFKPLDQFEKGLIYKLLKDSYASLLVLEPDFTHEYEANWERTDDDLWGASSSSGSAVISTLGSKPIGFVSWYEEGANVGSIGHNCIVPTHRQKGYGKRQVRMALRELSLQVNCIRVVTANHPSFIPARKTYLSCGFIEKGRSRTGAFGGLELVYYEHALKRYT
ncbi:MAG: GNAT family N-acetyltransferase [Candidatus Poribacteria bacterium]|nr:GNAT family N-acetyltransferase [Candidatus Poribacteria bacterium]